jgi:hypothetical protein
MGGFGAVWRVIGDDGGLKNSLEKCSELLEIAKCVASKSLKNPKFNLKITQNTPNLTLNTLKTPKFALKTPQNPKVTQI